MHPRLTHFPHHSDYRSLYSEYRPFVMYTHAANYRSPSVNTDQLGLREQYDYEGAFIDILRARQTFETCDVISGASTTFGVDATSDRHTISSHLQRAGRPCLNLGVRGATSRQELFVYLALKDLLPRPRNIVLLSGVNEVSLAAMEGPLADAEFGAVFETPIFFRKFLEASASSGGPGLRLHDALDRALTRSPVVQRIASRLAPAQPARVEEPMRFEEKLQVLLRKLRSDLETWRAVADQSGSRLHYVLQPIIGWHPRSLTAVEQACFDADRAIIPSMDTYTNESVHAEFRDQVAAACDDVGIQFCDANPWFAEARSDIDLFTDVCHMTDHGYALMSSLLRDNLSWQ